MFQIKTSKSVDEGKLVLSQKRKDGFIEFIGRTWTNNGIKGFVPRINDISPNSSNVISISQVGTITAQLRHNEWYASQNIFILKPTNEKLFSLGVLSTLIKSLKGRFSDGYSNYPTQDTLSNLKIQLPLNKNNEIDFDFMESFIRELEEERIRELNAYLLATGLKDYILTDEEENALEAFKTVQWGEFELPKIFDIKNTHNILSSEIVAESGTTPYLCASAENNGVSSYISYKDELLENGNCIFIGGKTFVVSYQKDDFYSNDSHNLALYLKEQNVTKANQLYLATCIYKGLNHKYSWGNSISGSKIKSDKFHLPTKDGKPDYATMETFIKAVEKLVIKDVVLYADKKIAAVNSVVKLESGSSISALRGSRSREN